MPTDATVPRAAEASPTKVRRYALTDVLGLAIGLTGASFGLEPRRFYEPLSPREHFTSDKPLTKRQRRRLRGRSKSPAMTTRVRTAEAAR